MAWQEIADGVQQGVWRVTMGRKDGLLNPDGIRWEAMPDLSNVSAALNPLLSGGMLLMSGANLAVSIDSNRRLRRIEEQISGMQNVLMRVDQTTRRTDSRVKAVQLKTEESNLREAIRHAFGRAFDGDLKLTLTPIKELRDDFDSLFSTLAEDNMFGALKLSSDVRAHCNSLFSLLLGLRVAFARAMSDISVASGTVLGINRNQFFPRNPTLLVQDAQDLHVNIHNTEYTKEVLREWYNGHIFTDADDMKVLASHLDPLQVECNDRAVASLQAHCAPLTADLDLSKGLKQWSDVAEAQLEAWLLSDSGLIFRLRNELVGLSEGYRTFWPELSDFANAQMPELTVSAKVDAESMPKSA